MLHNSDVEARTVQLFKIFPSLYEPKYLLPCTTQPSLSQKNLSYTITFCFLKIINLIPASTKRPSKFSLPIRITEQLLNSFFTSLRLHSS